MKECPTIQTERLVLRPFTLADAATVQTLVGDKDVASTTLHIPHPYEDGMAEAWIGTHQEGYNKGELVTFAIVLCTDNLLIGAISLTINQQYANAELGYWIGKPYWNQGYCTEAAKAVIRFGFDVVGVNRIHASHMKRNPASGQVMQKAGMIHEGCLRRHVKKWDAFEDLEVYGILTSDYELQQREVS
jgi:RimJ/RimL family protein N-acetyltransferase